MMRASEKSPLLGSDPLGIQIEKGAGLMTLNGSLLEWDRVSVEVGKKNNRKRILRNCMGSVSPNELCCLIGPSGSGKTTLLNALAGRISSMDKNARIQLNGRELSRASMSKELAFVPQEDAIYPTSTPREAIMFSAALRLPKTVSEKTKRELVEYMLIRLGLTKCADTEVGSPLRRGISGGEKKRTSIGVELVTNPGIIFLDEPTSGLDSFSAFSVVTVLSELAQSGCSVLCSIHQPSSEVFTIFKKVFLLADGAVLYGDLRENMISHFSKLGYQCPAHYNPADYVLFLSQTESAEALGRIRALRERQEEELRPSLFSLALSQNYGALPPAGSQRVRPSVFTQLKYLLHRELLGTWRNKPALYGRFGMTIMLNLLFALIFKDAGVGSDILTHFGALTQIVIGSMFGAAQPTLLEFPLERPVFLREYSTASYGAIAYFFSKTVVELALSFVQSGLVWLVVYWIIKVQGNIIYMIVMSWVLGMVASSTALMIGCLVADIKTAVQLSPVLFVPQMLFAGFFIKIEQIPVFLRWVQYLCSLKFAVNLIMIEEFDQHCNKGQQEECKTLLHLNMVDPSEWYIYALVLLGIFVVFRTLAVIFLRGKALQ